MKTALGIVSAVLLVFPAMASAGPIVVSAISADTSGGNANSEYVELTNISAAPVDLNGWVVAFYSGSGCSFSTAFALGTSVVGGEDELLTPAGGSNVVSPGGWVLISSDEASLNADYVYTATNDVVNDDRAVSISSPSTISDTVGWGDAGASCREGTAAADLGADNALVRQGRVSCPIDTDANNNDFSLVAPDVAPFNSSSPRNGCSKTLNIQILGTGTGTVIGPGINCPGDCTEAYATGSMVTLTAGSTGGSGFNGWGGDCAGTTTTCLVTLSADRNASATFTAPPSGPPSGGSATPVPLGAPGETGQRAAALKKCKKKQGRARRNCKKRANKLPL